MQDDLDAASIAIGSLGHIGNPLMPGFFKNKDQAAVYNEKVKVFDTI